jgi:ABC-type Mn2+/Zn2+ transport system permease subunit
MNDLLFLLGFSAFPLMTALSYAALTPALGATLHLRGEIMLGIVLPPFGSAVIGLCALGGISAENRFLLHSIVALSLFTLLSAPVFSGLRYSGPSRKKETVLAAVFVLGQTLTYFCMHLSPDVRMDLSHLLSGEILAVGPMEFWTALTLNTVLMGIYFQYRGVLFAFCLDETGMRISACRS